MANESYFNKSIIVLDDEEMIRMLTRKMLNSAGFTRVVLTDDPSELFKKIDSGSIDLIICDWHMPKISGLEVFRTIRNVDSVTPFIMLTSEKKKDKVVEALEAGVKSYIIKPFTKAELISKVTEQLTKAPG